MRKRKKDPVHSATDVKNLNICKNKRLNEDKTQTSVNKKSASIVNESQPPEKSIKSSKQNKNSLIQRNGIEERILDLMYNNVNFHKYDLQSEFNVSRSTINKWFNILNLSWKVIRSSTINIKDDNIIKERVEFLRWYKTFPKSNIIFFASCDFLYHDVTCPKFLRKRKYMPWAYFNKKGKSITIVLAFNNDKILNYKVYPKKIEFYHKYKRFIYEIINKEERNDDFAIVLKEHESFGPFFTKMTKCMVKYYPGNNHRIDMFEYIFDEIKRKMFLRQKILGIDHFAEETNRAIEKLTSKTLYEAFQILDNELELIENQNESSGKTVS